MGKALGWAAAALIATVLLGGCGSGGDYPSPAEGCQTFIDTWCDQNAQCVAPSERANHRETCEFASKLDFDCSMTVRLSSSYQGCIDALRATSCDGYTAENGIVFPETCRGVVQHD